MFGYSLLGVGGGTRDWGGGYKKGEEHVFVNWCILLNSEPGFPKAKHSGLATWMNKKIK